jgi:predicted nucleotidyltransferase
MEKEKIIEHLTHALNQEENIVFAYVFGSFLTESFFRDIDVGMYLKDLQENPYVFCSDMKAKLSLSLKQEGLEVKADQLDIQILNDAPFTFLKRIFTEGVLLVDHDPDLRTDVVEHVSFKYRECAGILAEASLL